MMQRHHLLNLLFAALLILPDTYAAPQARSFLSWLLGADEAKTEETFIDGYRPLLKVRKYNGVQIPPHNGDPTVFLNSPTSLDPDLPLPGSDQHFIDLLYRTAPFLPEHEFEYGPYLQPYLQSVSVESIDRFHNILELEGEAKIGLPAKTKLVKFLQFVKEQKMKPLRAAFQKKNDLIHTAMNIFPRGTPSAPPPSPPQPALAQVYFYPLPPNPSETIIVPARPTGYVAPPQPPPSSIVFVPPTLVHLLPPTQFLQPEFSPILRSPYFEHPAAQEIHENVFDAEKKGGPWADHQVTVGATEFVGQKQMNEENSTSTFSNEVETDEENGNSNSSKSIEVVQKRSHKENCSASSANSTAPIDVERVEKNGSTSSNTSTVVQTQTSTRLTSTTSNTTIIPEATELNERSKREYVDSSEWVPWDTPFASKRHEPKCKPTPDKSGSIRQFAVHSLLNSVVFALVIIVYYST